MALSGEDLPILGGDWGHGKQAPTEALTSVLYINSATLCYEAVYCTLTLGLASTSVIHKSQNRGVYMTELIWTKAFLHLFLDYTNNCHMVICSLEFLEISLT